MSSVRYTVWSQISILYVALPAISRLERQIKWILLPACNTGQKDLYNATYPTKLDKVKNVPHIISK